MDDYYTNNVCFWRIFQDSLNTLKLIWPVWTCMITKQICTIEPRFTYIYWGKPNSVILEGLLYTLGHSANNSIN